MIDKRIYDLCKKEQVDTGEAIEVIQEYIKFRKNQVVKINAPRTIIDMQLMVNMYTEASIILQVAYEDNKKK